MTIGLRKSRRLSAVGGSATVALNDRIRDLVSTGRKVYNLAAGDPDFPTPARICEAAATAMQRGETHYGPSRGSLRLRRAISSQLMLENGQLFDPATEIIVTASAKLALFITLAALLDPGDESLVLTPSWVSYCDMVKVLGASAVQVRLLASDGFRVRSDQLRRMVTRRTKVLIVNSPNNPTGRVYDREEVEALVSIARDHDLAIVSDEIYNHIIFGTKFVSPAGLQGGRDRTLIVNGFSKTFAMTGWRLGFLAGPEPIVGEVLKMQQHTISCASPFLQTAAAVALEECWREADAMRSEYERRTELVVEKLRRIPGVSCHEPQGSFYVFIQVGPPAQVDDVALSRWLVEEVGVATAPGSAFGAGGEGHLRLALTCPQEELVEACGLLSQALPVALEDSNLMTRQPRSGSQEQAVKAPA